MVLLYLVAGDLAKAKRAEDLLADRGVISIEVLNEFASVARRKLAMRMDEIRDVLSAVRAVCALSLQPTSRRTNTASKLPSDTEFSIYDSMLIAAALEVGCHTFWSEDIQHGQTIEGLTIRDPFRS